MAQPESPGCDGGPAPANKGTELARLSRVIATLCAGNRTLLLVTDEQALLNDMCSVIVNAGYVHASVGFAMSDKHKSVRWAASAGNPVKAHGGIAFSWADTEWGQTAVGTAIRTGKAVIGRQVHIDPRYAGALVACLRESALDAGYTSVAAFPMSLEGKVLGTLVIAAADDDAFNDDEVGLLHRSRHSGGPSHAVRNSKGTQSGKLAWPCVDFERRSSRPERACVRARPENLPFMVD